MRALGYRQAHGLRDFALEELELPEPALQPRDVLVKVNAIALNPVDYKIRSSKSSEDGRPVILGWDAVGVIEQAGAKVEGFAPGERVFYAGELMRDGCYAEKQAVDHRLIARAPASLSDTEAVSLPLTALTAWEALLERGIAYTPDTIVLIIGGAGGVGSIATQLIKARTGATLVATASRPETADWCRNMGADLIVNHHEDMLAQLRAAGHGGADVIFCTTQTAAHLQAMGDIIRPFGHMIFIDSPETLDINPYKNKSVSLHWEFMFAKALFDAGRETQGRILAEVAALTEAGKIKPTTGTVMDGLSVENIRQGHATLEAGATLGKIVLTV